MGFIQEFISGLPIYLLSLPVVLLSLSLHECCHGYVALKLGDPTARNFGRLTLNPLKHIDPIGFICMVLFHFGWANPVPINTRYFKNPRRDMALSAAAGPLSNIIMALIFGGLLRLSLWGMEVFFVEDLNNLVLYHLQAKSVSFSAGFNVAAVIVMMLYMGVLINFGYAIFNLLPIPPLDGSRIFYVFLPPKWYFGIMRYERIIMIVMLALLWVDILDVPLLWISNHLENLTFTMYGMGAGSTPWSILYMLQSYFYSLI